MENESSQQWNSATNILCVRLDSLGDVLMSTPAIRALKHNMPERRITLLTSTNSMTIVEFIPEIDEAIGYDAPWVKNCNEHDTKAELLLLEKLRVSKFDAAVIFTTYSQNPLPAAFLCYLSEIPLRMAYCHENPYHLLTHWVRDIEPQECIRHEVRRQLELVKLIGCETHNERLSFQVLGLALDSVKDQLNAFNIDCSKPWILLHPGATAASRRYPVALWIEAAIALSEELECPLVFTGGKDEVDLINQIQHGALSQRPHGIFHSLSGKLTLAQLGAIISMAPVFVSNNTGPAHIAAAVGTPIVNLYALTNPQHTPWQVQSRVLFHPVSCGFCYKSTCSYGHHNCMTQISSTRIVMAVKELLRVPSASENIAIGFQHPIAFYKADEKK